jgi:adenosylmethionine-8-amino-7-oxononanoate aminotransferase
MRELGVLAWARPIPHAIAFGPPLVMTDDEIEKCISALVQALR